jgi:hypothetical protein
MGLTVMKAIQYNAWMSIMDMLTKQIPSIAGNYGMSGVNIEIVPSYPKDLSTFHKPSIIVQRVSTNTVGVGMGNVLGTYFDAENNAIYDVFGMDHKITFQINIDATSNEQCSLMDAMVTEGILHRILYADDPLELILYDYTGDIDHPVQVGRMTLDNDIDGMVMSSNDNRDYVTVIRIDVTIIQHIVPQQELIDLSKGIKYNQVIKL